MIEAHRGDRHRETAELQKRGASSKAGRQKLLLEGLGLEFGDFMFDFLKWNVKAWIVRPWLLWWDPPVASYKIHSLNLTSSLSR